MYVLFKRRQMYVCVDMHLCMCVFALMYIYIYIYIYVYVQLHVHVRTENGHQITDIESGVLANQIAAIHERNSAGGPDGCLNQC